MADTQNQISERHQNEWRKFHETYLDAGYAELSLDELKKAKELAATLKVYQEGERKAYGFGEGVTDSQLSVAWDEGEE